MASLNIKNRQTYQLAQELAELTGESMTAAVTEAVRERLKRLRREQEAPERLKRVLALLDDTAARIEAAGGLPDHAELLYDEKGLPRSDR